MVTGKLKQEELQKRCEEVFEAREGDEYYNITVDGDKVSIYMREIDENGDNVNFVYEPNMTERPEALAYLLGQRNDFND